MVEAYGQRMPLNQVGTVSAPEPRLLPVNVWDKGLVVSTPRRSARPARPQSAPDGQTDPHPDSRAHRRARAELAKLAHKYAEHGRVAVRNVRRDGMEALKKAEKDHKISQDEHRQKSDEVQKLTDRFVKQVDECWPQGKRDQDGLMSTRRCPPARPAPGPHTSPSSWMATDGGRRRAACRAWPATARRRRGARVVRGAGELGIPC
jgi:ribosome recycling factor